MRPREISISGSGAAASFSAKAITALFERSAPRFEKLVIQWIDEKLDDSKESVFLSSKTSKIEEFVSYFYASACSHDLGRIYLDTFRHEAIERFGSFFDSVKNSPELAGRLAQFISLRQKSIISRRVFVAKYLSTIPEFRALLGLTESAFADAWKLLVSVVKRAVTWLWKQVLKLLSRRKILPTHQLFANHFYCDREKLWPLLMAFKNN